MRHQDGLTKVDVVSRVRSPSKKPHEVLSLQISILVENIVENYVLTFLVGLRSAKLESVLHLQRNIELLSHSREYFVTVKPDRILVLQVHVV